MITLLNIIRVIYSLFYINKYDKALDSFVIEKVIEEHKTYNLSIYEMCVWINYLKETGQCKNWSKAQMLREMMYHKNLYKYGLFKSRTEYCDFEETQTPKTYIKRIIGNCII